MEKQLENGSYPFYFHGGLTTEFAAHPAQPVYPRAHPPRTPHLLCIYLTFCLLSAFQDLRQKYKLELGRKHNKDFNRLHRKYHQERDDICSAHRQELKYKDKQVEVWHFQYLLHKIQ